MTNTPPAGALRAHLRTATRLAHDKLEGTMGLLDEQLDLQAYRSVLERFYSFWRDWEPHMTAVFQDAAFLAPRRRLHLLQADLATVGLSVHAIQSLRTCPPLILRCTAEALGSLYVMEGSTLGGQVIKRNVEHCLGFNDRHGCTYFAGYGTETGGMWRAFLAHLDQVPMTHATQVADGAIATFERLAWWFPQPKIAVVQATG